MRGRGHLIGLAAAALMAIGLTGCFKSDAPFITPAQAVYPFKTLRIADPEGQKSLIKRDGERYAYAEDPDKPGESQPNTTYLLIYAIEENFYLVQAEDEGKQVYLFAKRDGDKLNFASLCEAADPKVLQQVGIERPKEDEILPAECNVKDLNSLIAIGRSPASWTKSTTTVSILSIE
jgi:hypothetical protein